MKRSRIGLGAIALAAAGLLVLSGCTTSDGGSDGGSGSSDGGTITIATTNAFTSFNGETPQSNLDTNGMVNYLTGVAASIGYGSFFTLDPEFNIVPETSFGTFEKTSDDPLTVKYTLKEGQKWSDGEPVTADDMMFAWANNSGWFDDATLDEEGTVTKGTQYFSLAGSTTGYDMTAMPTVSDDNLSMTLVYDEPFVDWDTVNPMTKPAHIMAKKGGLKDAAALTKLIQDQPKGDPAKPGPVNETMKKIADFWNTGYDVTSMPTDKDLLVANGPFIVTDFVPEQSITLGKNPEYTGDHKPAYDNLVIRFIGDSNAQVTALQNGEINAMYPLPSTDTVTALEKINAVQHPGDQLAYDHLDLSFGDGVFKDANVREAFLKTVPRQQLVDSLMKPINKNAVVLDSQVYVPSQSDYKAAVDANGYDKYGEPDIEGAKELLAGATPTVRILYNTENPTRVDSFQAIKASAEKAGFVIEDKGSPDWGSLLGSGSYDASIFGWISPGIGNSSFPQIFKTGGGGNYNNYSNPEVDKLVDATQVTLDTKKLEQLKIDIDTATATDFYGLPLFQTPGLFADNGTMEGLEYFGGQTGIVWNAADWKLVK